MSERLTVSLEDGIPDKLRTLAGGERKVGAYLSGVVEWLFYHREQLETAPLSSFAPVLQEWIPRVTMSPEEQQQAVAANAAFQAELVDQRQKLDTLWTEIQALAARIGAEDARIDAWADARDAALATQQKDSSQNDA